MGKEEIDRLISGLALDDRKWVARLPEQYTFLRHRVKLEIDTESVPTEAPPPMPGDELLSLSHLVLANIEPVLQIAGAAYIEYHKEVDPSAIELVERPHLWISIDAVLDDGPLRWALVVGLSDAPDYGTHIEFDGAELVEVWSGD